MVVTDFKETKLPSFENHPPLTTSIIFTMNVWSLEYTDTLGIRYFCGQCCQLGVSSPFFFFFFFFNYYNFVLDVGRTS